MTRCNKLYRENFLLLSPRLPCILKYNFCVYGDGYVSTYFWLFKHICWGMLIRELKVWKTTQSNIFSERNLRTAWAANSFLSRLQVNFIIITVIKIREQRQNCRNNWNKRTSLIKHYIFRILEYQKTERSSNTTILSLLLHWKKNYFLSECW